MRKILFTLSLALAVIISCGCKGSSQQPANPNNPNGSTASTSPGNPTTQANPADTQQGVNQPNGIPQGTGPNPAVQTTDMAASNLSMMAMDFHSALLQADKAKLETVLATEYQRTRIDGTIVNKTQELASLKKVDDLFSMESQPAQINGDTATVSGKITLMANDMTGQKKGTWKTTDTFRKVKDQWVVVSSVEKKE